MGRAFEAARPTNKVAPRRSGVHARQLRAGRQKRPRCRAVAVAADAPRVGLRGFSQLVGEALEAFLRAEVDREARRKRAVLLKGALHARETEGLRRAAEAL